MKHRFQLCILMLGVLLLCIATPSFIANARAAQHALSETAERWGFDSEEGGGGSSYLGVDIADVTAERLSALKLKEEHGAEVTMVDDDAPAGKAGLKEHDVIVSLNGTSIESAAQLRRMIKETPPGRVVALGISRDGQPLTIKVQLSDRHKSMEWTPSAQEFNFKMPGFKIPDIDIPVSVVIAHSSLRSGLMVENITPQLGDFFGVKDGKGVLVRSVEKGSRSEKAGFRAGDIVIKVNNQPVHDTSDFTHVLHGYSGGSTSVTIVRDKKEQTLTLTLPEKKDSGELREETFDPPEISTETQLAIRRAEGEIARLGPEMEEAQRELIRASKEAQHAHEHSCERQKEVQKRAEELQQRLRDQQQRMHDQEEKLKREMSGIWTEI